MMSLDGRLFTRADDRSTLAAVLGIASTGSDNEQVVFHGEEEQCHDLSGRPAIPKVYQELVCPGSSIEDRN